MRHLFVHHHIGLGDHFDCNGLVRYVKQEMVPSEFDKIHVFAIKSHFPIIDYMYRDDEDIIVQEVRNYEKEYEDAQNIVISYQDKTERGQCGVLTVGHQHYMGSKGRDVAEGKNCWEYFYEQLNFPLETRVNKFYVQRDMEEENRVFDKLNPTGEPYIFLHDSPERGYVIDRNHFVNKNIKVIENDLEENPLHLLRVIEEAKEIHCIESSLKSIIEFYENAELLFYHDLRNHTLGKYAKEKWKTIKYDNN
tara:strand:- start:1026 stop:1775 length:750 start_codon:yes stop_codon:yes gene_type:complete